MSSSINTIKLKTPLPTRNNKSNINTVKSTTENGTVMEILKITDIKKSKNKICKSINFNEIKFPRIKKINNQANLENKTKNNYQFTPFKKFRYLNTDTYDSANKNCSEMSSIINNKQINNKPNTSINNRQIKLPKIKSKTNKKVGKLTMNRIIYNKNKIEYEKIINNVKNNLIYNKNNKSINLKSLTVNDKEELPQNIFDKKIINNCSNPVKNSNEDENHLYKKHIKLGRKEEFKKLNIDKNNSSYTRKSKDKTNIFLKYNFNKNIKSINETAIVLNNLKHIIKDSFSYFKKSTNAEFDNVMREQKLNQL